MTTERNSAAVLREAKHQPVAVLNHNKAAFYMLETELFEALMEAVAERDLLQKVREHLADMSQAVEVDLDKL